jgi:hypothetical protein
MSVPDVCSRKHLCNQLLRALLYAYILHYIDAHLVQGGDEEGDNDADASAQNDAASEQAAWLVVHNKKIKWQAKEAEVCMH